MTQNVRSWVVSCILRDVTERRRAQEALALSEQRLESIIASAPVGVHLYELDADGRLVLTAANPAADTILGVDSSQLIGLEIEEAFPSLASTELPERYRRTAVTGKPWCAEHTAYDNCQVVGVHQVHAFRISPGRIAVFFEDLTARNQAEEQKRNLEEQLRHSQKMEAIGRLAGGVAHDFNNMVAVITMNVQLALGNLPADHPVRGDLEEINQAAQRAADLTRQLLAFGRRQIIAPRVISLNESVAGIEKMLRRLLGEDIELHAHLASELAPVKVDPSQVEQIIMNLAVNARDAMPRGGTLTIETANVDLDEAYAGSHADARVGPHVMLAVSDTGSGMDSETVAQIFEPFFTTKERGKGTGLGLSTVYGIVKQSGGNIWVYSEPGKGTVFKVYLPIAEAEAEQPPRQAPGRETPSCGGETILLAEDAGALMRAMARMLANAGYHVLGASSGDQALRICRDHDGAIDLLLTDVVMPRMGGGELAERVRQQRPRTRVLFSSGYTDNGIAHHGVLESGVAFLQKPFTVGSLLDKVRDVLDGEAR